ncbi:MAG: DMT family transporter [Pyrinomonadaceae bacterium]
MPHNVTRNPNVSFPQNHQHKSLSSYSALLAVQLMFGSLPVIAKVVLPVIPAVSLVGSRVSIAASVLFAIQFFRSRIWLQERGDYLKFAVLSLFGVTLNQMLFIGGLSLTKASNTSLLAVTIPIFTLIASVIIGNEKLRAIKVVGILLAAIGVLILIDPRNASFSASTTRGDLMIVGNSLCFGIYVATAKATITRNGAFRSMMWVFIFASIICVPVGAYYLSGIEIASVPTSVWLLVGYIAIGATAVPYLLNAFAQSRVSPTVVAVFIYLQPLIGFTLAALFLGEKLDVKFAIAAILVFAGLYFTTRKQYDVATLERSGITNSE